MARASSKLPKRRPVVIPHTINNVSSSVPATPPPASSQQDTFRVQNGGYNGDNYSSPSQAQRQQMPVSGSLSPNGSRPVRSQNNTERFSTVFLTEPRNMQSTIVPASSSLRNNGFDRGLASKNRARIPQQRYSSLVPVQISSWAYDPLEGRSNSPRTRPNLLRPLPTMASHLNSNETTQNMIPRNQDVYTQPSNNIATNNTIQITQENALMYNARKYQNATISNHSTPSNNDNQQSPAARNVYSQMDDYGHMNIDFNSPVLGDGGNKPIDSSNPAVRQRRKWMNGLVERYGEHFEIFPSPSKIKRRRFLRQNYDDDELLKASTSDNNASLSPSESNELLDEDMSGYSLEVQEWLREWKERDPEICCVCYDNQSTSDDRFIYCDGPGCEVIVHRSCYGLEHVPGPNEEWYCERCKVENDEPKESVMCILCPNTRGAFWRLKDPELGFLWVHAACARHLTGASKSGSLDFELGKVPANSWKAHCFLCENFVTAEYGACIHCDQMDCKRSFHVTCGLRYSLCKSNPSSNAMLCFEHDKRGPQWRRWNSEEWRYSFWEHWVDRRDEYLKLNTRDFDGKIKCKKLWIEAFRDFGHRSGAETQLEDFLRCSQELQHLIQIERENCRKELQNARIALLALRKSEMEASTENIANLHQDYETTQFTVRRLRNEDSLLLHLEKQVADITAPLPKRYDTPSEPTPQVPSKRVAEDREPRVKKPDHQGKKKKVEETPKHQKKHTHVKEPQKKHAPTKEQQKKHAPTKELQRKHAPTKEPQRTLPPARDLRSTHTPTRVSQRTHTSTEELRKTHTTSVRRGRDEEQVCSECQRHEIPQETIHDVLKLSDEYMRNLEETKHLRRPGYTGRGQNWDPRVFIECAECHAPFHCGCIDPPVRNYPTTHETFLCRQCLSKKEEEEQRKAVRVDVVEFTPKFRQRQRINYKT